MVMSRIGYQKSFVPEAGQLSGTPDIIETGWEHGRESSSHGQRRADPRVFARVYSGIIW
jgi:hypothetical protein